MDSGFTHPIRSFQQLYEKQSKEIESILSANRQIAKRLSADHLLAEDALPIQRYPGEQAPLGNSSIKQPLLLDDRTSDLPVMKAKSTLKPFAFSGGPSPSQLFGLLPADGLPIRIQSNIPSDGTLSRTRSRVLDHMFRQDDALKDHVETVVDSTRSSHNLFALYHGTGFWQSVAKSNPFQAVSLTMISLNMVWMGFDIDLNHAQVLCEAPLVFQVVDNMFCAFFFLELVVHFLALSRKVDAFCDVWFLFDLILVFFMVWETWIEVLLYVAYGGSSDGNPILRQTSIMRVLRVARFTRVFRTGRWFRNFPEMMIMASGMVAAMRSVASVLGFMLLVVYLFAVMFTLLLSGTDLRVFDNILQAANFLLCQTLCGSDASFILAMLEKGLIYYLLFLFYLFLTSLTLMNMMVGVLVQTVNEVSDREKEWLFTREVHRRVMDLVVELDVDHNRMISSDEFHKVFFNKKFLLELNDIDVDVAALGDFAAFIFRECDELTFSEFEQIVLNFRVSKSASTKDVLAVQKYISQELREALRTNLQDNGAGKH